MRHFPDFRDRDYTLRQFRTPSMTLSLPFRSLYLVCLASVLSACAVEPVRPLAVPDLTANPLDQAIAPRAHPRLAVAALDLNGPLDQWDLARIALAVSPALAAARSQVGVADAQLLASGLLADPQLSLSFATGSAAGLVSALGVGIVTELSALLSRAPRRAAAAAAADQIRNDVAWTEWLAINQVRLLVCRIQSLERQRELVGAATAISAKLLALQRSNLARGDARIDEVSLSLIADLDTRTRSAALERALTGARLALNAALGVPPGVRLRLDPTAAERRPIPAGAALELAQRALDARYDFKALREGVHAADAGLALQKRSALPLPQLSLSRERDSSAVWTRGISIAADLPLWNGHRGDIAIADATRAQLAAEYAARASQAYADIFALFAELDLISQQRSALAEELPALRDANARLTAAARDGAVAQMAAESVRAALLDKELQLLELEQASLEARINLDTSVGDFLEEPSS